MDMIIALANITNLQTQIP